MNREPLVSILIPVYNREKIVKRALESALNQTYKNIEIICVDNNSTDNTYSVLEEYAMKDERVKIYRQNENVGPVRNWLTCLSNSSGDFIKFLWSDDEITCDCIEKLLNPLIQDFDIGFSYSKVNIIFNDNKISENQYQFEKHGKLRSKYFILRAANLTSGVSVPVSPGCALIRRCVVEKYLKVNFENDENLDFSRFGAGNDALLFYGACKEFSHFYYVDEVLSVFYGGNDSFSINNNLSMYYSFVLQFFLKDYDSHIYNHYLTIHKVWYKDISKLPFGCNYLYFLFWVSKKLLYKLFTLKK